MDCSKWIERYLKGMVKIPSVTGSPQECLAGDIIEKCLREQPYFAAHPEHCGQYALPEDSRERGAVYGLVYGGSPVIVLTGHYDVVGTQEYGAFQELAYSPECWEKLSGGERERLLSMLSPEARADFLSGQWLFGRGVSDMKGGLAIGMAVMRWYGERGLQRRASLLFLAVPDEEAYSAGMRGALPLLQELKERWGLRYACLIDLEPCLEQNGALPIHLGSVGKLMPAVLVQGTKAHVLECFRGINAAGVLAQLMLETELSPELAQRYEGEVCPPPTWLNMRDRKEEYDVSVPLRAAGYMNLLYLKSGGADGGVKAVMEQLRAVGEAVFRGYYERMRRQKERTGINGPLVSPGREPFVMTFGELTALCREKMESEFDAWYGGICQKASQRLKQGEWSYPQATLELMDQVLTWSGITRPLLLLGFAPPFYPVFHSSRLKGRGREGEAYCERLCQIAEEVCGGRVSWRKQQYFYGISDLSYCGELDEQELRLYASNTPVWGSMYHMDAGGPGIPSLLFGPEGRDIHQMSERVRRVSLLRETPKILQQFIEQMFENTAAL